MLDSFWSLALYFSKGVEAATATWNKELFSSSHIQQIQSASKWQSRYRWMVYFVPVIVPSIVLIGFPCDQSASPSSLPWLAHILLLHYLLYIQPPALASAFEGSSGFLAVNLVSSRCSCQLMCSFVTWYVFFFPRFGHQALWKLTRHAF